MTLAQIHARVVDLLTDASPGVPVFGGPPFALPPAPPCYVVEPPQLTEVLGATGDCRVTAATTDIMCVPPTSTDLPGMFALADAAIAALGAAVVSGGSEQSPYYPDTDDQTFVYRLTYEE